MDIPGYVQFCISRLEDAGFDAWAVGGCVRDSLLGTVPHDWDLCTSALPSQIRACFPDRQLVLAGEKHGTVSVVQGKNLVEITTYRAEGGYTDSRHPGWVAFQTQVEADLARRDFTINAMAFHPHRGLRDPFGGREDLNRGILRAVGDPAQRFSEDALRILRGVRFAARLGLTPEPATKEAMCALASSLDRLARERVFDELNKLLAGPGELYGPLRAFAPVITAAIPALAPCVGFDQRNPHHALTVYDHIAAVTAAAPRDPEVRWAALLHDVAKPACFSLDSRGVGHFYGHAHRGAAQAEEILTGLRAPKHLTRQVCLLIEYHGVCRNTQPKTIRRLCGKLGLSTVWQLLALDRSDSRGKPGDDDQTVFDEFEAGLRALLAEAPAFSLKDLAINGRDLQAAGMAPGPEMGRTLQGLLSQVLEGSLPNTREALLAEAEKKREKSEKNP